MKELKNFMERNPELRALMRFSGLTVETIKEWEGQVFQQYDRLASVLPDSIGWKIGKPAHARRMAEELDEYKDVLGLEGLEIDIVRLLLVSHDVGRMVEAGRIARKEPRPPWLHGEDSMLIMQGIMGKFASTDLGKVLLLAIKHHSNV